MAFGIALEELLVGLYRGWLAYLFHTSLAAVKNGLGKMQLEPMLSTPVLKLFLDGWPLSVVSLLNGHAYLEDITLSRILLFDALKKVVLHTVEWELHQDFLWAGAGDGLGAVLTLLYEQHPRLVLIPKVYAVWCSNVGD